MEITHTKKKGEKK